MDTGCDFIFCPMLLCSALDGQKKVTNTIQGNSTLYLLMSCKHWIAHLSWVELSLLLYLWCIVCKHIIYYNTAFLCVCLWVTFMTYPSRSKWLNSSSWFLEWRIRSAYLVRHGWLLVSKTLKTWKCQRIWQCLECGHAVFGKIAPQELFGFNNCNMKIAIYIPVTCTLKTLHLIWSNSGKYAV